jgi:hypothetical protein
MAGFSMPIIQINLHHSESALAILTRNTTVVQTCIAMVQKPWLVKGVIRGLGNCGKVFKANIANEIRTCVIPRVLMQLSYHSSGVVISLLSN